MKSLKIKWTLILVLMLGALASCAAPTTPVLTPVPSAATRVPKRASTSVPSSAAITETPASVSAAPVVSSASAQVPGSCSAIASLVGTYMAGGVSTTKSLVPAPKFSCEFGNASATTIIIINIGAGATASAFDALKATSAQGGRTVTAIDGLGTSAFAVSKNGVPGGVSVLTAQGMLYVVESNLPIAKDQALIEQLMQLP